MSAVSSSSSALSSTGLNFTGLSTGIDTSKIIDGLTALNQKKIDSYKAQEAELTSKRTVFATLNTQLVSLQGSLGSLSRAIGGAFQGSTVTASDTTSVSGVSSSSAIAGSYSITVNQLAQVNQVASSLVTDQSTNIQTGTVTVKAGAGTPINITVDSSNNTLQGLATSINNANGEVKASVVGDSNGYRLLLTGTKTGAANSITVTNNLSGGGAAVDLSERQVQAAKDSSVTLGNGAGAITVTSPNNRADNLISGVSLSLLKADPAKTLTVNVTPDTDTATKAVSSFVDAYNSVIDSINSQSSYNATTQTAGPLLGNSDIVSLKSDLAAAVGNSVSGVNPGLNRMSTIGLSFDNNGKMRFDSSKLTAALSGQVSGVSATDVKNLFALSGSSTNSGVNFLLGSAKTRPSPVAPTPQPYQVNISSAATQGSILAGVALPPSVVLTSGNNTFNFKLNALTTATIVLDPGTYDAAALAAAIQQQLSGRYASNAVSVDLNAGRLRFTSAVYGGASQVALEGGNAVATLGFTGTEKGVGTNVAGSFTVGGKTETAVGNGQILAGLSDNANTAGLQVRIALSASQVPPGGTTADLTVTQGLASRLSQTLDKYTDSISGRFKTIDDRFSQSTATIESTITRQNAQLTEKKNALVQQFADLETSVSSLKNIGNTITASFGVLSYK